MMRTLFHTAYRPILLVPAAVAVVLSLTSAVASADDVARLYLTFGGDAAQAEFLRQEAVRFEATVTQSGLARFTPDREVEEVMTECRAAMGVDPTQERACRLRSARRLMVDYVLELEMRALGDGTTEVRLASRDGEGQLVFSDFVELKGVDPVLAARDGLSTLATRFVQSKLGAVPTVAAVSPPVAAAQSASDTAPAPLPVRPAAVKRPDEVGLPGADDTWLRCPLGEAWDGRWCLGDANKLAFDAAQTACPSGFGLPTPDQFVSLLVDCDQREGRVDCDECEDAGRCRALFGDDEGTYWSASGVVANLHNGDVGGAATRASVRCIRTVRAGP